MLKAVFIVMALAATAFASDEPTQVTRCRSGGPLPLRAQVEGCVSPPCRLPQLSTVNMSAVYNTISDTSAMRAEATAFLGNLIEIPIRYDLGEQSDGCKYSNATCPVGAGATLEYSFDMFIESLFPVGISVNVEFSLRDNHSQTLFCMRVPITIVAPVVATIDGTAVSGRPQDAGGATNRLM